MAAPPPSIASEIARARTQLATALTAMQSSLMQAPPDFASAEFKQMADKLHDLSGKMHQYTADLRATLNLRALVEQQSAAAAAAAAAAAVAPKKPRKEPEPAPVAPQAPGAPVPSAPKKARKEPDPVPQAPSVPAPVFALTPGMR